MKRLLLSTALILGTLTGVKGANADPQAVLAPAQQLLRELDSSPPSQEIIEESFRALREAMPATGRASEITFNTQKVIDTFLSDIVKQATFSLPRFEAAMIVLCLLSHLYVHWISDDPTKITSYDKSRIAVPITSALTVKALDSARKIWNDYQRSSATKLQTLKAKLQDSNIKYYTSFLLACVFIVKNHTSEPVIKAKLQEIFSQADDFSSIDINR
jgi:hypothetical protein